MGHSNSQNSFQKNSSYSALLFMLPEDESDRNRIQDIFLTDPAFWSPWLARLHLWTRPLAVTKTELGADEPALVLFLQLCEQEEILHQVGKGMAERLEAPAYTVTSMTLSSAEIKDLNDAPKPWLEQEQKDVD